jgi:hypothetical protein
VFDTVANMALAAHKASSLLEEVHGVRIPARLITREESDRRVEGFITHAKRDPARRRDPGEGFPWAHFFDVYTKLENPAPAEVDPTRGKNVDLALRRTSAAITAADKAKGPGARGRKLEAAIAELTEARKVLRSIALVNDKEGS